MNLKGRCPIPMYNYGSEAIELEYSTYPTEKKVVGKVKKTAGKRAYIASLQRKALLSLGVIAALLCVLMAREAYIDKLCGEITKKEESIHNLNAIITEKEMYISGQMDINMIEEMAISRLGMKKPDSSQIIYIDVEKKDGGEILTEDATGNGGFSAFINKAKILLEYLY